MTDDTRRTAAERLRDMARDGQLEIGDYTGIDKRMAEACAAGAEALDLFATQAAEIARLRVVLEESFDRCAPSAPPPRPSRDLRDDPSVDK